MPQLKPQSEARAAHYAQLVEGCKRKDRLAIHHARSILVETIIGSQGPLLAKLLDVLRCWAEVSQAAKEKPCTT